MHKNDAVNKEVKVAVVGGSGYAGLELVKLLQRHPLAWLRACFNSNRSSSFKFSDYLPNRESRSIPVFEASELKSWVHELDTVFLATPAEVSLEMAGPLLKAGVHVIDLSGAFRLNAGTVEQQLANYQNFYHLKHPAPDLLARADYGLRPWQTSGRRTHNEPALIANPGCYASSVLMALLPLLTRKLIDPDSVVIDAKSGASGAGRKAAENLLFTEVEGECLPYRIGKHQHLPEITQFAKQFADAELYPAFATHLLPIRRGIITSMYAKLAPGVTLSDVNVAFCSSYSNYDLCEWGPLEGGTDRKDFYNLSLKRVVGTALTRVHFQIEGDRLYLFSLIDNLIKGAAGQAVENFNALKGIGLSTGLSDLEGVL